MIKVSNIEDISRLTHKTMITVGMFDGVHVGHQHILSCLRTQAAQRNLAPLVVTFHLHPRLVLGIANDDFRQLMTTSERIAALERSGIDNVALVHFSPEVANLSACQFTQRYLIDRLNVGALVLGYDNMFGSKRNNDFDQLPLLAQQHGFTLMSDTALLHEGSEVSSTRIRKALADGQIDLANQMLGSPYSISGTVVHGRGVGHSIGFPTANVQPDDPHKAIPAPGVYAVRASLHHRQLLGIANVGPRPTFQVSLPAIEVHLLDHHDDIYHQPLTIHFDHRLRDILHFQSVSDLTHQIEKDRARARELYN